jgi:hypothetical protein
MSEPAQQTELEAEDFGKRVKSRGFLAFWHANSVAAISWGATLAVIRILDPQRLWPVRNDLGGAGFPQFPQRIWLCQRTDPVECRTDSNQAGFRAC